MIEHLRKNANIRKNIIKLDSGDVIVDIGSNDGAFLFFFRKYILVGINPNTK